MIIIKQRLSLTLVELLTVICIILIIAGLFAVYAKMALKTVRETALINELINLRMSIKHYRIVKGVLPEDLFTLANEEFTPLEKYSDKQQNSLTGFTLEDTSGIILHKNFLKPSKVDKQGFMVDPFMHRYLYDKRDGRVRPQTKGYENW